MTLAPGGGGGGVVTGATLIVANAVPLAVSPTVPAPMLTLTRLSVEVSVTEFEK